MADNQTSRLQGGSVRRIGPVARAIRPRPASKLRKIGAKKHGDENDGKNRIIIYGPKRDGTYVVEFKTAAGEALAISVPVSIRS